MPVISLHHLSKTYNPGLFKKKVTALRDLDLDVQQGEVFGLVGPNGAGKSTTIRLLLGLMRPDSGDIRFQGRSLQDASFRSEIGYLPENPYLYDHLSLDELLWFAGQTAGMQAAQWTSRVDLLLEQTGMAYARKRRLRTFSKGMLQRAGICFALLHDPGVVILDEPMSGLDPLGRKQVIDIILTLKAAGKTVFFCSHILSDVERLCDRIGILVAGRLVKQLDKAQFRSVSEHSIHLQLGPLGASQQQLLDNEAWAVTPAKDAGCVLSLPVSDLERAVRRLREEGVEIQRTLAGQLSLEDLFVQTVKENQP